MADKSFGVKELNLISASGTPTITSPNSVNINATNVAISTDITVGGMVSLGAGTSISSPGSNVLTFGTNSTEKVRITSGGKIGINDTNPERAVDIRADNCMIQLEGTGGNGRQYSLCSTDDTTGAAVGSAGQFVIYDDTSGNARLSITSTGDIGIANVSPTNWGAGVPTIEIKGTVSSGGNATRSGAIAFESGSGSNGYAALWGQNGGIHIYTGATDRASATYAAQFNSSGNLAFASGNGIDFSATGNGSGTMSSELLDDYEEGSWTPDLQFGGAKAGITYNNQWGRYTKVGNLVTVIGRITLSNKGSSGGIARFFGLPYATESITGTQMSIGSLWYSGFNLQGSIVQVVIRTDSNGTSFVEPKGVTTNAEDSIGDSDFTNSTDMVFTISYRTS